LVGEKAVELIIHGHCQGQPLSIGADRGDLERWNHEFDGLFAYTKKQFND
jgi:hypothetical protein